MKPKFLMSAAVALLEVVVPVSLAAQDSANQEHTPKHHHYQLIDIGTFGGPNSTFAGFPPVVKVINNSGMAVGGADTPTPEPSGPCFNQVPNGNGDCYLSYGFKWQDGIANKLGALPGFNSSFPISVSDNGLVAGISENGIDPLTGSFAFEAVLWRKDGSIFDLGTLGGNDSIAYAVNNRGQAAGGALNTIPDPYAASVFSVPGVTQVHAFRWTTSRGMQDLGTLGGTDSFAVLINERGEIAGESFTNTTVNPTTSVPTLDPFLWKNGKMLDLGTLGGTFGQANGLNNRGQVVGFSDLAEDSTEHPFLWSESEGLQDLGTLGGTYGHANYINDAGEVVGFAFIANDQAGHAFLWRHGVMTDLGTLGADPASESVGVNSQGQVVGQTFGPSGDLRAFLWEEGGPVVELNTLIPPNRGLQLTAATYINDHGEIAAFGLLSNGDFHAFILTPCDENHPGVEGCDYRLVDADSVARVQAPQVGRTPSGTMQNGITIASPGRLRARMARR
jgi:probable HAF family extracellular repeat protein